MSCETHTVPTSPSKQIKVDFGKVNEVGLRDGHTDHFAVAKLSIVGHKLKVVVANTSFLIGLGSTGVAR